METGFYYLQTRYYDPDIGRFISPDSLNYLEPETINGLNLYAYCLNNPVMYEDPEGNAPKAWQVVLGIIGVALVATAAVTAIIGTGGIGAFGVGALIGSLSLGAVGAAVGGVIGYATGGTEGILGGVLAGFGIGAIVGFVVGGLIGLHSYNIDPDTRMIKEAFKKLDKSGLRPGQTEVSKSKIMEIYKNYDPLKAKSSIHSMGGKRYLVDGHHTTVANMMRGGKTSFNMGMYSPDATMVTNVYWSKKWYQFGRVVIKLVS